MLKFSRNYKGGEQMAQIQWFPGHMNKAKREVSEKLKFVDIVLELVDARLPLSSRNPLLNQIIQQKPRLMVLNKRDLADEEQTKAWIRYYEKQGVKAIAINAKEANAKQLILKASQEVLKEKRERDEKRGIRPRAIRGMIIGIPNVGKSTLLNRLVGKNIAQTGNKPGVTKGQQWLKISGQLELLDTPGILWPKFEDKEVGEKLALTGAIKDQLLHLDDITLVGLRFLAENYPTVLKEKYHFTEEEIAGSPVDLLLKLTKDRGFKDDYEKGAIAFLTDLRNGRVGRFTFDEIPSEEEE